MLKFHRFSGLISKGRFLSTKARLFYSKTNDIRENLALESFLVDTLKPSYPVLFMWRNNKTVIVGKNQNVWKECNIAKMEEDDVKLVRRFTGGGCVYQDLGNSCFSFVHSNAKFDASQNNQLIIDVLKESFNIEAELSGRNDLTTGGRKFSGQSFKHINNLVLHNGTLLFSVDGQELNKYLTPDKSKLLAKGVSSVASRVVNLSSINPQCHHDSFSLAIFQKFAKVNEIDMPKELTDVELIEDLVDSKEEYKKGYKNILTKVCDWNHVYGQTPPFTHAIGVRRFEGLGTFDVTFDVKNGRVQNAAVFSDCLDVSLVEDIRSAFVKEKELKFEKASIEKVFKEVGERRGNTADCDQLCSWIISKIEE
eukprot:GDKJ01018443.1.p1 GENE.GDKJ01018443.1~~GDKJ01018443.1.p1  ORF type:complete len:366 (-),score=80.66 GDKJ01018443.1:168-1265(-)